MKETPLDLLGTPRGEADSGWTCSSTKSASDARMPLANAQSSPASKVLDCQNAILKSFLLQSVISRREQGGHAACDWD